MADLLPEPLFPRMASFHVPAISCSSNFEFLTFDLIYGTTRQISPPPRHMPADVSDLFATHCGWMSKTMAGWVIAKSASADDLAKPANKCVRPIDISSSRN